jgi:hypothetical protein
VFRSYYSVMSSGENKLLELKIAGRYRMIPVWATKFEFEVRPSPKFDNRAWKLWKPILKLLAKVGANSLSLQPKGRHPPCYGLVGS